MCQLEKLQSVTLWLSPITRGTFHMQIKRAINFLPCGTWAKNDPRVLLTAETISTLYLISRDSLDLDIVKVGFASEVAKSKCAKH
jgi:hypothetical protein